jgi:phospholipid/cholesterol/gamma-HCH transport system substrate-binding protein
VQGRYDIHKHVYVVGGVDDIISRYERRAFFVGAGLEFNDDDLKYLAGSLPVP